MLKTEELSKEDELIFCNDLIKISEKIRYIPKLNGINPELLNRKNQVLNDTLYLINQTSDTNNLIQIYFEFKLFDLVLKVENNPIIIQIDFGVNTLHNKLINEKTIGFYVWNADELDTHNFYDINLFSMLEKLQDVNEIDRQVLTKCTKLINNYYEQEFQ